MKFSAPIDYAIDLTITV